MVVTRRPSKTRRGRDDRPLVLCGAGISIDSPSHLPSGGELFRLVIEMLLDSAGVVLDCNSIRELRRIVEDLRLELGLEVLSRHISPGLLVQVYAILRCAVPNYNHLALAVTDVHVITTNQDILIENAAARLGVSSDVLHLHGRCDRPASVITLISQYMAGLPGATVVRLREKLRARHVLVLGYSGRDRDVMDVLEQSEVAHVQWVQHPGSGMSPELQRLQNALGVRMSVESGLARTKLAGLLKPTQENAVRRALRPPTARPFVPRDVRRQFASIPPLSRNLGLAAILHHASLYREAEQVYAALGGTSRRSPAALLLALASARAHQQNFDEGLEMFSRVITAPDAGALEHSLAFLGQVEILRNSSKGSAAARKLEKLAPVAAKVHPTRARARVLGRAATQTAGIERVDGRPTCRPFADVRRKSVLARGGNDHRNEAVMIERAVHRRRQSHDRGADAALRESERKGL